MNNIISESTMRSRQEELANLKVYLNNIEKEVTMILQNLQWDQNNILQGSPIVTCKYNKSHKMPSDKIQKHEEACFLKCLGYSETEHMLPEPWNINSTGLVKLSSYNIQQIINAAAQQDYQFIRVWVIFDPEKYSDIGQGCSGPEPLTLERLQVTYTADERRAIHNAVVNAVPSYHDLSELALPSGSAEEGQQSHKSRLEVLAQLRDMKRRRAKYRAPARSRNYSDVLRSVIATQMEFYSEALMKTNKLDPVKIKSEYDTENMKVSHETSHRRLTHREAKDKVKNEDMTSDYRNRGSHTGRRERDGRPDKYHKRDSSRKEIDALRYVKYERADSERDKRDHKSRGERCKYYENKGSDRLHHRKYSHDESDRSHEDKILPYKEDAYGVSSHQEKQESYSARDRNRSYKSYIREDSSSKSGKVRDGSNERENRDDINEKIRKRHSKYETNVSYESKAKYKRYYD